MEVCISNKTLLIISGGIEALPGIQIARNMGLFVIVSDGNPNAPGFAEADDQIISSTYDVDATIAAALTYNRTVRPIDGVISIASDVPLTVASVAEALNLSCIPVKSARLSMNKLAMKRCFAADQIPAPWFSPVRDTDHLKNMIKQEGYPLVLKPVDSRGARGVLLLNSEVDIKWAFHLSRSHSPSGCVMLERFLSGPQVSTESLVLDGTAYTPGFSDRNYEYLDRYAPYIIENGGELPSCLPEKIQKKVCDLIQQAALKMGIRNGSIKGDIVIYEGKPHVIELAPRLSGGYFCTHEIPLNTGVDFVGHAIRLALGERPEPSDLDRLFNEGVAQRYLFPEPGRITRIDGADEVELGSGVALCEIRVAVGDIIGPINSHPARAGVVIATANSRQEAINRAVSAVNRIRIETVPSG